jgi:hypothetical protein
MLIYRIEAGEDRMSDAVCGWPSMSGGFGARIDREVARLRRAGWTLASKALLVSDQVLDVTELYAVAGRIERSKQEAERAVRRRCSSHAGRS